MNEDKLIQWVFGAVAVVTSTLSGLVTMFYKQERASNATAIQKLESRVAASDAKHEECQKDRLSLSSRCAGLEARLEHLEKRFSSTKQSS